MDAGYRDCDEAGIDLLRFVGRLRSVQLPLDDIREREHVFDGGHRTV
jgi:DNA-binding transcriptional MerR regulator